MNKQQKIKLETIIYDVSRLQHDLVKQFQYVELEHKKSAQIEIDYVCDALNSLKFAANTKI